MHRKNPPRLRVAYGETTTQASDESVLKILSDLSSDAVWCYDLNPPVDTRQSVETQINNIESNARLIEGNKVLLAMLGLDDISEILGMGLRDSGSRHYMLDLDAFVKNNYRLIDYSIVRQGHRDKELYFQISCAGIVENNQLIRVWGTTKDITARRRYEEKLHYQFYHDVVTGLPNREKLYLDMEACFSNRHEDQSVH